MVITRSQQQAAMTTFALCQFEQDINPGDSTGLKLYLQATKEIEKEEDCLEVSVSNAKDVLDYFTALASRFGWARLTNRIAVDGDETKSIFKQVESLSVEDLKYQAWGYFSVNGIGNQAGDPPHPLEYDELDDLDGNAIQRSCFYDRVRSDMIAKAIEGHITKQSMKKLRLENRFYEWKGADGTVRNDGPTMLYLLLKSVNPATRIGLSNLKEEIEKATLARFNNNVNDLLNNMSGNYTTILQKGVTHEDYVRHLFRALLSGPNSSLNCYIERCKDDWDTGADVTPDSLIQVAKEKYNNMVAQKEWNKTDPKDAKILALTTRLNKLEKEKKPAANPTPPAGSNSVGGKGTAPKGVQKDGKTYVEGLNYLELWRTIKKGGTINRDGKKWHWCPKHKMDGKFNGLYMEQSPDGHDEWEAEKQKKIAAYKERRGKRQKTNGGQSAGAQPKTSLQLSNEMKAALMTDTGMTQEQVKKMIESYNTQEN